MSAGFDALHEWFAIGPGERPPTHYRLLNLAPFESNPHAIENQARLVQGFLQQQLATPYAYDAQQMIALVQRARTDLLDPARKAAYDQSLRGPNPFGAPPGHVAPRPIGSGAAPYSGGPARPSQVAPSYAQPIAPRPASAGGAPNPYAPAPPDPNAFGLAPPGGFGDPLGGSLPSAAGIPATKPNPYQAPKATPKRTRDSSARAGEVATRRIRLVAAVTEVLCHMAIVFVISLVSRLVTLGADEASFGLFVLGYGAVIIVELVMICGSGQNFGKMMVGIKIVTEEGEPPGFIHAILLRVVFMWVIGAGLLFVLGPLGPLFFVCNLLSIFGEERRCLHDYLASTRVVYA